MKKALICIILILIVQLPVAAETIAGNEYFINTDGNLCKIEITTKDQIKVMNGILDNVTYIDKGDYAIDNNGVIWFWADDFQKPTPIMNDVLSVSSGYNHTLIVKEDNTLWGYGINYEGQLGKDIEKIESPVKIMNNVKKAAAGYNHSVILKTDGSVLTLGSNAYGELGYGEDINRSYRALKVMENAKDVFSGESSSFAIDDNNVLWRWGTNYGNGVDIRDDEILYTPVKYVENVKSVRSHWGFNLVLKKDDTLWLYGESEYTNTGYTCFPSGINFKNLPKKLMSDVNSISDWNLPINNANAALILKNNGELFQFDLQEENGTNTPYRINKLVDNVKLMPETEELDMHKFTDILSKSKEIQESINSLSKAGIVTGISETEFSPDKPITRAEIAALLLRMTAKAEESGNGGFADVTEEKWYYNIAGASKKYDIISGYNDNTFRGDEPISNIQLISLVSRMLQCEKAVELKNKETKYNVPQWANTDIAIAVEQRLISDADISDSDIVTRGEAAVLLYRLYEKI